MATDELDELLLDRFHLHRSDLIAALKTLPAQRPWAAALTADSARLLDSADFTEDSEAFAEVAADATAHMARLYSTAYSAAEVRHGLGVSDSRVRQRRLAHTLWAIDDGGAWVYPALQFQTTGRDGPVTLKAVRGLDEVLAALITRDLHPTAIADFIMTAQPDLRIGGEPASVRDWLLHGEPVEPVLALIEIGDWTAR
jgi:hypothetical protein